MTLNRRTLIAGTAALATLPFGVSVKAAAPLQGAAPPVVHRYKIGAFEITAISDGTRPVDKPETTYGVNQKPEDVAALLQANFLPTDKMLNGFTPVIVNTGKELVLFDTGLGAGARPGGGRLKDLLATAGFTPEQIDVVVITHCHPDHIGGLMEDGKPLAPKARYVIGETEFAFWSAPERLSGSTENAAKLTQANVVPQKDKMSFIKNEGEVVSGIRALEAFGHTPGHIAYHVESDGKRLLIGGDFCNHFVLSLQRPDWHVRFDADKDRAAATRKRFLDMLATDRIPFTSYHMPFPAVGFVDKASDGGYRFVPAAYQLTL
jgi:glyoxylase-like metal-dependent hydrolase (beta-lactamase superfamily II)